MIHDVTFWEPHNFMATATMVAKESTVSRNPDVLFSELGDKTLMMSMESGNYHELDHVGSIIWKEIEHPRTVSQLCGKLCERYDVSDDECLADVLPFLNELDALGVIQVDRN